MEPHDISVRAVIEALKEISRKRIRSQVKYLQCVFMLKNVVPFKFVINLFVKWAQTVLQIFSQFLGDFL